MDRDVALTVHCHIRNGDVPRYVLRHLCQRSSVGLLVDSDVDPPVVVARRQIAVDEPGANTASLTDSHGAIVKYGMLDVTIVFT